MSSETNLVKAIYSFKGKNNDELCFKKGDIITVTQRVEGGWWEGTLGETTGWFPSNYVTEYKDSAGSVTTSPIRAPADIQTFRNVVLKDIIDSEKAHVAEMQGLVTNFLEPLEKSDILTRDEFKQLTGNISEVLQTHEQFLSLVEDCAAKTGHDQRVGGLFLQWAPNMKVIHQRYCSGHPKAVCILDKYKEELNTWMESAGAVCPGVLVLTAGLSKPFRRLGKYPAMLQELARHVLESHPDRGDTQRAALVYRDIDNDCSALRRQKELELQVVTGEVRGWPGGELSALGDVLHMGSVAVGPSHQDRYLVLFQNSLLLLSVSKRVSAFVYEGNLPLTGISVCKLDDTDNRKNAFEISGPMIDPIIAVCQTKAEADNWVSLLQKHSNSGSPVHDIGQPSSLPHLARSPSEGALSSINSNRRSLYHVTLPPSSYPSASPYYSLTKYFAKLVKKKVITRQMLRKLLHEKPWAKAFEMSGLPIKRRHKNQIKLRVDDDGNIETETECSDTEESDCETDTTESYTNSSCTDDFCNARIPRQDALDHASPRTLSSATSSCGSNFGYVRYFNQSSDVPYDLNSSIKGDCTKSLFDSISSNSLNKDIEDEFAKEINSPLCRTKAYPALFIQNPLNSEDINTKPYNMAYEDLVNIDDDLCIQNLGSLNDDFETTRRSFSNCNECSREVTVKPWKSAEEEYCGAKDCEHSKTNSLISSDLVYDLDPPKSPTLKNYTNAEPILDPPPMFRNNLDKVKVMNMPNKNIPFRNHSINSDKRIRRSVTKSLVEYTKLDSDTPSLVDDRQRMSAHSDKNKSKKCECCNRSLCHSPRSSDSGVVGSCNLASPELNLHEYVVNAASGNYLESRKKSITSDDIKFSTVDILPESYNTEYSKQSRLSELEAAKFEDQCRCTSPFDSTPRTSCETSFTTENVFVGFDSSRASVTSTYSENTPVSSAQPLRKMQRTSIRADINQHLLQKKVKPKPPPRLYRQPSTHLEVPKNVRQPIIHPGWSTINISERTKPSLHYHMRIFREKPEVYESRRESRKDTLRNCDIFKDQSRDSENGNKNKKSRSRSEDLSKLNKLSKETQTGFMVYRSDLYAHWWMKAKLPITVVSDSGKDYYFMTTTDGSNGLTNHKRSHSFNNHQSFSQHSQQTQKNKQHNQSARWLLNSCDSLDQPSIRPNKASIGTKFCSVDFIDTAGTSYVNTKGWSVTSLRPAPPLRPQLHSSGSDDCLGQRLAYAPNQRKSNSYEEDALILKVIEAYCTSARCRNAVSSEGDDENQIPMDVLVRSPSLPIHNSNNHSSSSLWTVVLKLQNEVKNLKMETKSLKCQIMEERHERVLAIAELQTKALLQEAKESKC